MEKSHIKNIDQAFLQGLGFTEDAIEKVNILVNRGIEEHLYTKTIIPYHNMKHIEKVIMYIIWILNLKEEKGELLDNKDLLLVAALYHDSGRSKGASNKNHGVVGAKIARSKLKDDLDEKSLDVIELLIETHASKIDQVNFKNKIFMEKEKKNIQILSNILKDADALDRNRIKLFPFAQCKIEFLRTDEAKYIYPKSNNFLEKYESAK